LLELFPQLPSSGTNSFVFWPLIRHPAPPIYFFPLCVASPWTQAPQPHLRRPPFSPGPPVTTFACVHSLRPFPRQISVISCELFFVNVLFPWRLTSQTREDLALSCVILVWPVGASVIGVSFSMLASWSGQTFPPTNYVCCRDRVSPCSVWLSLPNELRFSFDRPFLFQALNLSPVPASSYKVLHLIFLRFYTSSTFWLNSSVSQKVN